MLFYDSAAATFFPKRSQLIAKWVQCMGFEHYLVWGVGVGRHQGFQALAACVGSGAISVSNFDHIHLRKALTQREKGEKHNIHTKYIVWLPGTLTCRKIVCYKRPRRASVLLEIAIRTSLINQTAEAS